MLAGVFLFAGFHTFAQSTVDPQRIEITFNKTSNIVFPSVIKSVDRGSRDLLAQKVRQVENVLQVKAGRRNFQETNLTVITSNGKLHNFIVNYSDKPEQLNWFIDQAESTDQDIFFTQSVDEKKMQQKFGIILTDKSHFLFKNVARYGMSLSLFGIYVEGRVMFYRLHLINRTNIDYDMESLRFYVIDKQRVKRTASQEVEQIPVFVSDQTQDCIKGNSEIDLIYALEKFTIPEAKRLIIEVFEKHGGRHLKLSIKNATIVGALPVPES